LSIIASVHDGLAIIEIARPVKKNALTLDMYDALADALVAAQADANVYALVMTGQPGVFTAGNDLEDFLNRPPGEGAELEQWPVLRFMRALLFFGKPIVAAVTGVAVGIGTTMLLHCDLVYLSEDTRLFMPFVKLGLVPEFASSAILPQLLGPGCVPPRRSSLGSR
jgi:enoyl-CoA hydratase/carnithine racemase